MAARDRSGKLRYPLMTKTPGTRKRALTQVAQRVHPMGVLRSAKDAAWLRARLKERRLKQKDVADAMFNGREATMTELFKGERRLTLIEAGHLSRLLGVPLQDVLTSFGLSETGSELLYVVGYLGADEQFNLYDQEDADGLGEPIESPFPGYRGLVFRVCGSSMAPRYRHNELVAFRENSADPTHQVGYDTIVKTRDGRLLLKVLHRGSEPNLWTLSSVNPENPPISDVEIEWASEVDWHKPKP